MGTAIIATLMLVLIAPALVTVGVALAALLVRLRP